VIEFRNVTKVFGTGNTSVRAVNNLSFTCPRGAFLTFMGPSGSGKSTVLHLISGLTAPTSGTVFVDGDNVTQMNSAQAAELRRRRIGYILQSFNLLPFLTVEENVGMPLILDSVKQSEVDQRVKDALETVNMSHRAVHHPTHLSGGEQQRVAIARALVIKPAIVLADEPTGNLDRAGGRAVLDLIQDINERMGVTILLVTHDPVFGAYGQRVLRLVDGALQQDMKLTEEPGAPPTGGSTPAS
jgi:putative ABC transport system ATP-binding protein